jgi:excisionase family DNA binding protein
MAPTPRFLTLTDVAEILQTSNAQVYALVRRGELPAIRIGGRGQWRVEDSRLEDYIARMYDDTRAYVDTHPFSDAEPPAGQDPDPEESETPAGSGEAS